MNKTEFLQELEKRLHVLNEQERKDVLEEYAQHINLKIESGLSEEEAVRVFGSPEELAAELLDAYRINSEYAAEASEKTAEQMRKTRKENQTSHKVREAAGNMAKKAGNAAESAGHMAGTAGKAAVGTVRRILLGIWHFIRRMFLFVRDTVQKAAGGVGRMFGRLTGKHTAQENVSGQERGLEAGRAKRGKGRLRRIAGGLMSAVKFCCVLFVRAALILLACPVILLGLCFLFLTGVVLVLIIQGYPVVGIGVGSFGIVLAAFGVTGLLLSFVFKRKNRISGNTPSIEG